MASYISYAERQTADQINWAEIGKNLSDTLYKEAELRQQKKDAIDKASREYGEKLNNAPTGEYKNGSEWVLNYAYNAQEARLLQDRLLKSGQLSLRDYAIGRQNLEDGTTSIFTLMKEYQEEYSRKMKEYQEGTTSGATVDMMGEIEGLANLTTSEAYINPTTFNVNLATKKMNKDGVYEMDGNFVSVGSLRNRVKMDVKKYDINTGVDETIKTLGQATRTEISRVKGARGLFTVKSVIDARNRDDLTAEDKKLIGDYTKWENNAIGSILSNDFSKLSILRDSSEKDYQVTFDREAFENDKTGKLILMDQQSNGALLPKFKKEQEEDAKEILKNRIRNGIDQETKVTAVREEPTPRPPYKPPGGGDADKLTSLENWAMFGTGTAKQKAQAKNALLNDFNSGKKEGERLLDIIVDTDNNQMTFKYDDGTESSSTIPSNTRDWLNLGKFIHGVEGKDAQQAFSQFLNKPITTDFSEAAKTKIKKFNRNAATTDIMSSINFNKLIVQDDDNKTAANLNANPILRDLGIQFVSDNGKFNQEIIFTKPFVKGKESPTIRIPINNEKQIASAIQTIRTIVSSYAYDDDMMKYSMGDGNTLRGSSTTTMQGGDVRGE